MPTEFEDQLAIFKAVEEGKKIEYYDAFASIWVEIEDKENYLFNFRGQTYRIKPEEPKVLHQYLIRNRRGDIYATGRFFQSEDECRKEFPLTTVIECLHYTRTEVFE
jgi:hypothetical protein